MRFLLAILSFGAVALAQVDLSSLPTCAVGILREQWDHGIANGYQQKVCVGDSITSTGCSNIDAECICKSSGLIDNLACCVSKDCDSEDQQSTFLFLACSVPPVRKTFNH